MREQGGFGVVTADLLAKQWRNHDPWCESRPVFFQMFWLPLCQLPSSVDIGTARVYINDDICDMLISLYNIY